MLSLPPPNREIAQPSNTTIRIITIAIQPPATIAAINAFVTCNDRFDSRYGGLDGCFSRRCRCLCGSSCRLRCFLCGFCRSLCRCLCGFWQPCCVVFMAALEVTCAVFYASFRLVFTEPFAAVLDGFSCTSGRLLNRSFGICCCFYGLDRSIRNRRTACSSTMDLQAVLSRHIPC